MQTLLTVTSKGQVTLRKEVLAYLGVAPGDKIAIELLPAGRAEVRAAKASATIDQFLFSLKRDENPVLTIEQMAEIAAAGWAGKR